MASSKPSPNAQTTSVFKQQVESININNADCDQYTQNQIKQRTEPTTINNEDTKLKTQKKIHVDFLLKCTILSDQYLSSFIKQMVSL